MKEGRSIYLKESDRKLTATSFPDHIIQTGATVSKSDVILTYGKEALSIGINGVFPNYPSLEAIKIKEGASSMHAIWRNGEKLSYCMKKR